MEQVRESGILLHPTSLPGQYGIGELGGEAEAFVDALARMGQSLWQILPLGPTSYGDSPYQSLSTFAGNTLLISFDRLVKTGLLHPRTLRGFPAFPADKVDYGSVIPARRKVLATVCRTFGRRASESRQRSFRHFCKANAYWLDDYALFIALKDAHGGAPWTTWERELVVREEAALRRARRKYATAIRNEMILQYLFDDHWRKLLKYAHKKGVRVIGDIPIFVAHDSSDVWANQNLFYLDATGQPSVVAGVPPDYFSATGQLWGNPLYNWELHRESGYTWWIQRLRKVFEHVDIVRIDHFRGFDQYWEIHAEEKTAINGCWVDGPGALLFEALLKAFGKLPIIAEDLGLITPPVEALRDKFGLPGMRVLQFAFGLDDKASDYRPENFPRNCVVYTGTHDNDTTVGWYESEAGEGTTCTQAEIDEERHTVRVYLGTDGSQIHWDLIGLAMRSKANTVVTPVQDLLGLGSSARMNIPGRESGNWQWRVPENALTVDIESGMLALAQESRRTR